MKITTIKNVSNITVVNGRVISKECSCADSKKIDETKSVESKKISKIKIDCDSADVTIAAGNSANIEAHCYGEVYAGNFELNVTTFGDEISISAKINESIFSGSLRLDVLIPQKVFKLISAKCANGYVKLCENVETKCLELDLQNGNMETEAHFQEITANSINGSIDISIIAKSDIEIFASSMNGNVNVKLENIGSCNISTSSMNGTVRNSHGSDGKYNATGNVSSMNGNVRIK